MAIRQAIIAASILLAFNASAELPSAASANAFVPPNYKVVETIHGDLNKDGQKDVVLLVKATDATKVVNNSHGQKVDRNRRGIVIAFKNGSRYRLALKNLNSFASENEEGGVYFPPELSIETKRGNLLIEYKHGRYGYWTYTFRYHNGDFELIGYDSSEDHGPIVDTFTSINLLSQKMLTKVNTNKEAEEGGQERFKESWKTIKNPKTIKLSEIKDFNDFSVKKELGLSSD